LRFVVLIPAYKPGPEFPSLVRDLLSRGVRHIVVVDDGSGPEFRPRFAEAAEHPQVRLCRHAINLGKGAALKTGINAILCEYAQTSVVVTADADHQHHPDDIVAVGQFGEAHPEALIMGVRSFSGDVPLRSRLGNLLTRGAMHAVVGQRLTDTQTGLRAIPYHFLPTLLKVVPQGYDFELDMLLQCREKRVIVMELPIRTIYLERNASSHFNPLLDSMRIYFVLLRFATVSTATAIIDNGLFSIIFFSTSNLVLSQICARIAAMLFNFAVVKRMVFKSHGRPLRQLLGYTALVAVSGTISFGLIRMFVTHFGMGVLRAKLFAEAILFFANFLVQRDVIFTASDTPERAETERQLRAAATPALQMSAPGLKHD
jgi:glycosyltransferase involved in cell wall biosynthesis